MDRRRFQQTRRLLVMIVLAVLVKLLVTPSAQAGVNTWTTNGPEGGTVTLIAVAPSDPQSIYALTYYGTLFKSRDGGDKWSLVSSGLQLTALVVDPGNPEILYAIGIGFSRTDPPINNSSVIKSVDGGQTWHITPLTFTSEYQLRILAISPAEPRILYIAVACYLNYSGSLSCPGTDLDSPGVYRSVDGGESWTRTANAPVAEGVTRTETLAIDPQNSSIVYRGVIFYRVGCWRGDSHALGDPGCFLNPEQVVLFKSTDRGEQWIPISTFPSLRISSLIIDPLNPQILYGGDNEHVFKSVDGGQSWTNNSAGLPATFVSLISSPTNSQILYVSGWGARGPDIFRTVDGGLTWVAVDPGPRELFSQGILISPLVIDPRSPETLYTGYGDRGFLKSSDGGTQWAVHNTGLVATTISGLATTAADSRTVYAWSHFPSRLYVSTDGGKQWSDRSGAFNYSLSSDNAWSAVVVDSTDPQTLYIGTYQGVYRSSDGGQSWTTSFEVTSGLGVSSLAIDTKNPQTLYVTVYSSLYKTTDGGQNWGRLALPTQAAPYLLVIDPTNSQILYAVGHEGGGTSPLSSVLFVSVDGGQTWTPMPSANLGYGLYLVPAPSTPRLLYATSSQGLLKSTDGGATWIVVADQSGPLVVDPTDSNTLYGMRYNADVGGSVFKSTDGGYTWNTLNKGLITTLNVQALVVDPTNPRVLYAGTDGGGVFQIEQQPPLRVTSITPTSGTTKGGTVVTISGENFLPGAVVTIGGTPATNVTIVNITTLTATTPPGTVGTANVVVINPGCTGEPVCSATLADAFTYVAPPPPAVQLTPSALDFGTVKVGKRRSLSFKMRNSGTDKQTVLLSTTSPFSLRSAATVTVKPGRSAKVKVQFAPATAETFTGTVVVTDPTTEGSLSVSVSGVGVGR